MIGFQLLQLLHELVEVGVRKFWCIHDVIQVFVMADFFAELFYFALNLLFIFGSGRHAEIILSEVIRREAGSWARVHGPRELKKLQFVSLSSCSDQCKKLFLSITRPQDADAKSARMMYLTL